MPGALIIQSFSNTSGLSDTLLQIEIEFEGGCMLPFTYSGFSPPALQRSVAPAGQVPFSDSSLEDPV